MTNTAVFPFSRAFARFTDYLIWGMLTVALFAEHIVDLLGTSYFLLGSFCVFVFFEAFLISSFGTTLGKRLLGIYVLTPEGKKLSYRAALKRSILVFGLGMGFFLPYISLIFPFANLYMLVKFRSTYWDRSVGNRIEKERTSYVDKFILILFYALLCGGWMMTIRSAIDRELNLPGVEQAFMLTYLDEARPMLIETLSERALQTPEAVNQTAQNLIEIQDFIQKKTETYELVHDKLQRHITSLPIGELRTVYQDELDAQSDRITMFLFTESIRVSLFQNIISFFQSAENQYHFIDGQPTFENADLKKQYDNYIDQLEAFLSAQNSADNTALDDDEEAAD